jgi:deoxyadenosine/deoxycytidine kinase
LATSREINSSGSRWSEFAGIVLALIFEVGAPLQSRVCPEREDDIIIRASNTALRELKRILPGDTAMSAEACDPHELREKIAKLVRKAGSAASAPPVRLKPSALAFVLDGEIGAGKTEGAKALAEEFRRRGLRVCLVLEPVEQWRAIGILGKFYESPARFGYSFQTYVYATRVLSIVEAVRDNPDADIFILERSPATDHVFMELQRELVDPVEMKMYYTWCKAFDLILPIDLSKVRVLYLRTSLDVCMSRLAGRKREGETPAADDGPAHDGSAVGGVSPEYQARLRRAHEQFLRLRPPTGEFPHLPESPYAEGAIIPIEAHLADKNFRDPGEEQAAVVAEIIKMMGL